MTDDSKRSSVTAHKSYTSTQNYLCCNSSKLAEGKRRKQNAEVNSIN